MTVNASGAVMVSPTGSPETAAVGTPCWCEQPTCPGTGGCYREFAGSESGWREIADRPARWVLADGTAV